MKFCIVGGFPRAGTRQFTDFLNKHDAVQLKGEVYPQSLPRLSEFIAAVDQFHAGKWPEENYRKFRAQTILNTIAGVSKGTNAPFEFATSRVFGFKTPYVEIWKSAVDELFVPEAQSPIQFFYCVRNLGDNFLSQNAFLGVNIATFIRRTTRSLISCLEFLEDDRYACEVLDLDEFVNSEHRTDWVASHLYGALGVKVPNPNKLAKIVDSTVNRNSTATTRGERRTALQDSERQSLAADNDLRKALDRFREVTGHALAIEHGREQS